MVCTGLEAILLGLRWDITKHRTGCIGLFRVPLWNQKQR